MIWQLIHLFMVALVLEQPCQKKGFDRQRAHPRFAAGRFRIDTYPFCTSIYSVQGSCNPSLFFGTPPFDSMLNDVSLSLQRLGTDAADGRWICVAEKKKTQYHMGSLVLALLSPLLAERPQPSHHPVRRRGLDGSIVQRRAAMAIPTTHENLGIDG